MSLKLNGRPSWYKLVTTTKTTEYHGTVGTAVLRHGTGTGTVRERNLLALPTLDMYLPLFKFESIHRVYIALRCNNNLL